MVRAVVGPDDVIGYAPADADALNRIAKTQNENEAAKSILIQRGYGSPEMSIDAIVKLVPKARSLMHSPSQKLIDRLREWASIGTDLLVSVFIDDYAIALFKEDIDGKTDEEMVALIQARLNERTKG